ncbi:MAG: universal stress protein [Myxococcota bacterium]
MNTPNQLTEPPFVVVGGIVIDETGPVVLRRIERFLPNHEKVQIHLCHVLSATATEDRDAERAIEERLEEITNWVRAYVLETIAERMTMHVAIGAVDDVLLRLSDQVGASAIVVGVSAESSASRLTIGSTGRRLIEYAECPVLFATPEASAEAASGAVPPRRIGDGRYHYRRTIPMTTSRGTVGAGGAPFRP